MTTTTTIIPAATSEKNLDSSSCLRLKSWTVQEYHRMAELGILNHDERTELIAGQITLMVAKGTPHVLTLRLLTSEIKAALQGRPAVFISTQDPIHLDDSSEPEPDLAIVRDTPLDYINQHPQPPDLYLVVEVADSTLKTDCEVKDKHYAHAGITDYWVIDIPHRQVHIFRAPTPNGYSSHLILTEPQTLTPLAFPDVEILISAILPPL
jgi:Uma2 family endonuclease